MQQNHIARTGHKVWPADRECVHGVLSCACQACELNISSTLYNSHDKRQEPVQWDDGCCSHWPSNYVAWNGVSARSRFHETQIHLVNSLNLWSKFFAIKMEGRLKLMVFFLLKQLHDNIVHTCSCIRRRRCRVALVVIDLPISANQGNPGILKWNQETVWFQWFSGWDSRMPISVLHN